MRPPLVLLVLSSLLLAASAPDALTPVAGDQAGTYHVAYLQQSDDFSNELRLIDQRTNEDVLVAPRVLGFEWSPVGEGLAYIDDVGLWLVDPLSDDVEPSLLLPLDKALRSDRLFTSDWHPDGQSIAINDPAGIISVQVGHGGAGEPGSTVRLTTGPEPGSDAFPRWSPDGRSLAFFRYVPERGTSLMLLDTTIRPDPVVRTLLDRDQWRPYPPVTWTPDGSTIMMFVEPRQPDAVQFGGEVFVDAATGSVRLVPAGHNPALRLAISPDGRKLAYWHLCVSLPESECPSDPAEREALEGIYTTDLVTGQQRRVADAKGSVESIAWTPDARSLVYASAVYDPDRSSATIWVAEVSGAGEPVAIAGTGYDGTQTYGYLQPTPEVGVTARVSGPTRVETAVAVSRRAFDSSTDTVLIARADGYADALAAAGLAGAENAPVLLTAGQMLSGEVREEIRRLDAGRAIILGDESAVPAAVAEELADELGVSVERLAGSSRFGTAAAVAAELDAIHAFVVQGVASDPTRGWPDAVAVSALAAQLGDPVLLVETDRLPAETANAIRDGGYQSVTIVGGTPAVSESVESEIRALGVTIDRLSGATRYGTSAAVARDAISGGADPSQPWLAIGTNWPDSLTAGPAAAHVGVTLVLVDGTDLAQSPETASLLQNTPLDRATLVGGPDVLTPTVAVMVEQN